MVDNGDPDDVVLSVEGHVERVAARPTPAGTIRIALDINAFLRWVRPKLIAFARKRVGTREAAEDVVQQVLADGLRRALEIFDGGKSRDGGSRDDLRRLLEGFVLRACWNHLRRGNRELNPAVSIELAEANDLRPDERADLRARLRALQRATPNLSAADWELLMLRAEGYKHSEIAKLLGISVDAVKKRLERIRATIAGLLEDT
jgi:RNA polymerase sigma factor (sigma-70 family)